MKHKHGTPDSVVSIIRKHIPTQCQTILEPAVGTGALLTPLRSGSFSHLKKVVAIDINPEHIKEAKRELADLVHPITFQCADFMSKKFTGNLFDCIVMNPPFNARASNYVDYNSERLPIEQAFLTKCSRLLKSGGRLIAILPSSIISGSEQKLKRIELLKTFSVRKVYELNSYTFPRIEGRFYLLIADKRSGSRSVAFEKPFSNKTAIIKVSKKEVIKNDARLDFSYYFSTIRMQQILEKKDLNWRLLQDVCDVTRGGFSSPNLSSDIVHTCNYKDGIWRLPGFVLDKNKLIVENKDILLKRVSRDCHTTFGMAKNRVAANFSDCVYRIRPRDGVDPMALLFSLRVIYSGNMGKHLLVRGSGANYIGREALYKSPIPIGLKNIYPSEFRAYSKAFTSEDVLSTKLIEKSVRDRLFSEQ